MEHENYDLEMGKEELSSVSSHSRNYRSDESLETVIFCGDEDEREISDSKTIFMFDGEQLSQSASVHTGDLDHNTYLAESISGISENSVYLEYAETENRSIAPDLDETDSFNDNSSIAESIELDPDELNKYIIELYKSLKFPHCDVCNISFRTLEQLDEHSSSHDAQEIVTCEVCKNIISKAFYSIHLKVHRELYHQRLEKRYTKAECTVCRKYIRKSYMKVHMMKHGSEEEKAKRNKKCTICDTPLFASYLNEHMRRVHMQKKVPKGEDKEILRIKCPICSKMFRESTYKRHVASHARTKKKYICEECGKEFFSPSTFATHLLTHKEEYKYTCQFCPYRGKHLGLLKVHVRIHTKDYSYKCATCGAGFITKSNLTAHEKTHLNKVKFMCSQCGKCFTRERSLQVHTTSIHEGIREFSCDICEKTYACKIVLKAHKKRVHNIPAGRIGRMPSYLLGEQGNLDRDVSCNTKVQAAAYN